MWVRHYYDLVDLDKVCSIEFDGDTNEIQFYFAESYGENCCAHVWNFSDTQTSEMVHAELVKLLQAEDFSEINND